MLKPNRTGIPDDLKKIPQWVVWRSMPREPKPAKVPHGRDGTMCSVAGENIDLAAFMAFDEAWTLYQTDGFDGVGLVLLRFNDLTCVDVDTDEPEALAVVDRFTTFVEVSVGGGGRHAWMYGHPPTGHRNRTTIDEVDVEVYTHDRFIAVTGVAPNGKALPVERRSDLLAELLEGDVPVTPTDTDIPTTLAADRAIAQRGINTTELSDVDVIRACRAGRSSKRFFVLFDEGNPGTDASGADYELAAILCAATTDDEQVIRLMDMSSLRRKKWTERRPGTKVGIEGRISLLRYTVAATRAKVPGPSIVDDPSAALPVPLPEPALLAEVDPPWLVAGTIPRHGFTLLVGRYGAAKSFVLVDLAAHIARGKPWYEHDVTAGGVIYVYGEGSFKDRVDAWRRHHGTPTDDIGVTYARGVVNLLDPAAVDRFAAAVANGAYGDPNPALIIFDTLTRMTPGGDENSSETAGAVIAAMNRLSILGCHVVLAHHTPWDKENQRPRGHSRTADAADAVYLAENDEGTITLTCQKMREAEAPRQLAFSLTKVEPAAVLEPAPPVDKRLTGKMQQTLDSLRTIITAKGTASASYSEWEKQAREDGVAGFSRQKVALVDAELVIQDEKKRYRPVEMDDDGFDTEI